VVDITAEIRDAMNDLARRCVAFVNDNLIADFVEAGMPAADTERVILDLDGLAVRDRQRRTQRRRRSNVGT
jgi:hypothetical protein